MANKHWLSQELFTTIIDKTPLVSIDLVVRGTDGRVLLGKRLNRPAYGYWFVPGGRILKGETLAKAFERLTLAELGVAMNINDATYLGLYEHFYEDFVFGEGVTTHYVVNGFEVQLPAEVKDLPSEQHGEYAWFEEQALLSSDEVHVHSKWYFDDTKGFL